MGNIVSTIGFWTTATRPVDYGIPDLEGEQKDVLRATIILLGTSNDVNTLTNQDLFKVVGVDEAELVTESIQNLLNQSNCAIQSLERMLQLVNDFKVSLMKREKSNQSLCGFGGDDIIPSPGGLSFPQKRMLIESSLAMKTPLDFYHGRRQCSRSLSYQRVPQKEDGKKDGRGTLRITGNLKANSHGTLTMCNKTRIKAN